ncbi:hypothetical protein [Lautropia dentalis]|uniref:hypothetical protein n=1 Tax=Lautropia dentalis TaxID=2490857 RepID=UPI0013155925|nr:hypothetical protein [Lautropia dentalis]
MSWVLFVAGEGADGVADACGADDTGAPDAATAGGDASSPASTAADIPSRSFP